MSTRNNDEKNGLSITRIETSDTISQFMEKCNNNFSNLLAYGGGTVGAQGEEGEQGVPAKPKVPIHIWIQKGEEHDEEYHYITEESTSNNEFEITSYTEDLSKAKYQEGHLIILQNAHVYSLENDGGVLKPKFKLALQSYDKNNVIDGKNAYVHIAYSNTPTPTSREDFVTDQQLREENNNTEPVETYSLKRSATTYSTSTTNMDYAYMGIYSDNTEKSSVNPSRYTWVRIQGQQGIQGIQGEQGQQGIQGIRGEQGDAFTGQPFSIDLSGDMSTLSLDTNGRSLYNDGSNDCKCTLHAYYGKEKHKLSFEQDLITITPPSSDYDIIKPDMTHAEVVTKDGTKVGDIQMYVVDGNIDITFRPDSDFDFLKKTIPFTIGVGTIVHDTNDNKKYTFIRNTIWIIKGIVSDFKLDIKPQYRIIKRLEDGNYYPKNLEVSVYKTIGGKRELFDFNDNENQSFKLLCNVDNKGWDDYPTGGVSTENTTHLEFKVVKVDKNAIEEIWDYEDVWVVADGKGTHYYHADLGNTESMMVLTTGEKEVVGADHNENKIYCAKLRNKSGYSITFNPKFYDGTTPITVINASVQTNIGDTDIYVNNGSFAYEDDYDEGTNKLTLTITKVPYNIDTLPLLVNINAEYYIYDEETGNVLETKHLSDTVDFNVYISTITNIYSLVPTAAAYNTSTGKTGDTIGCDVYKNNEIIPISDLNQNGLTLKYIVDGESGSEDEEIEYTEPIIYGDDSDIPEDEFTASDVAIVFILYYGDKEVVRSTVPLIKDGIDGRDGDTWQYIFCRSPYYDFAKTGISDPSEWGCDPNPDKSNAEYLGELESDYPIDENENLRWYDDHKGVDSDFRYEYQAYRKWDKYAKCWGKYGKPTLYSNYSEDGKDGSGYNVMLSNPVSVIPVGHDDWSTNENSDSQKDYTFIYLYNNTTDITSETDETGKNKVSISLPEDNKYVQNGNFTVDNNAHKVSFIPVFGEGDDRSVFDFQSNTQYKLPITVTYELGKDIDGDGIPDIFTTTVYWTLTPIKGLEDIEVFVDKRVINISDSLTHNISVGYYLISNKNKQFINSEKENKNKYQIILTQDITNLSGENVVNIPSSNWSNYNFTVPSNSVNKNWYVVLVDFDGDSDGDSDGTTIIDYTNIITVKDGSDGRSAIHLELTQDYISLPCLNGKVHPSYDDKKYPISSRMTLYDGDEEIEEGITYSFKIDGESSDAISSTDGKFTIDRDSINGDTNIECIATYNDISFHKTLLIELTENPYELELSTNVLVRGDNNHIVTNSLSAKVKFWDVKQAKWEYTAEGVLTISGATEKENIEIKPISEGNITRTVNLSNSTIEVNTTDEEFRISYYADKSLKEELTYETLGVIKNGKDGADGDGWQYIFCKSALYPFDKTEISNPEVWYNEKDKSHDDPNEEFIPNDQKEVWFDEHQGVDSKNKYEYQSFRRWNKVDKCWTPYRYPTLYSNYSESGSGYSVLLSNPVAIIPVGDDDWSVDESLGNTVQNQSDSTFIYFYDNVMDISKSITVELPEKSNNNYSKIDHFTCIKNESTDNLWKVIFNPTVIDKNGTNIAFDFGSNAQYKLPITIKYETENAEGEKTDFSTTTNWTLTPIKGLSDIEVFVDKKVVNVSTTDTHTFRVGYYLISTSGGKTFIESRANGDNKYNIVLRNSESDLTPGAKLENISDNDKLTDWNNVEYDFVDDKGINKNCYVVLVDNSNIIIDYTTVTSIKNGINGANGTNGADGASAMHLELTQDYIAVPAKADGGGVHPDFGDSGDEAISSQMILYDGNVEIKNKQINGKYIIEYEFKIDGETIGYGDENPITLDVESGIFTINDTSIIKGDTNLECIAKYGNGTFYKTVFIDLEETPYELEIDKNTLSRKVVSVDENDNIENGYIVDTSINVKVKYWKNGSWCYVTDGDVLVEYSEGEVHFTKDASNKTYTLTIAEDNIKKNIIDLEVKIVYKEGTNILSYENIGIINNGVDGVTKFKSTVFTRSVEEPEEYPKDGSFNDPNPINSNIWKDGIPEGSEPIWSSYRWFSNKDGFVSSWSKPVLMCDTPDFEVIYSSLDDITNYNPNKATVAFYKDKDGGISKWLKETGLDSKWTDDGGTDSIWMATINKTNGKWGKWTVSKIKGENGADGTSGTDGDTPELIKTERIGFSTTEHPIPDGEIGNNYLSKWKASIGELGDLGIAQPIYILYKQTWKYKNSTSDFPTYYITTTLSGTQGVEGKSRVLFYLGSFKNGEATLTGESVIGHLTPERCDYYIDFNGQAWMRIGQEDKDNGGLGVAGSKNGNGDNSDVWQKSEIVGFLQAGAIHADMINTDTITANSEIVTKLFSEEITANNLKVNAANITGTLTIGSNSENKGVSLNGNLSDYIGEGTITSTKIQDGAITTEKIYTGAITADKIATGVIPEGLDKDDVTQIIGETEIDGGKIRTDSITAVQIKGGTITANEIDVENLTASILTAEKISAFELDASQIKTGIIDADRINVDELSVEKLNTNPNSEEKSTISIADNTISIINQNNQLICSFSDNNIELKADSVFNNTSNYSKTITGWGKSNFVLFQLYQSNGGMDINYEHTDLHSIGTFTSPGQSISFTVNATISINFGRFLQNSNSSVSFKLSPTIRITTPSGRLDVIETSSATGSNSSSSNIYTTVSYSSAVKDITKSFNRIIFNYIANEIGEYKFTIGFKGNCKASNTSSSGQVFSTIYSDAIVEVLYGAENTSCATIIYGNGILIKNTIEDNTCGMLFNDECLLLKFGKNGIKIDANGIKYSKTLDTDMSEISWKTLI